MTIHNAGGGLAGGISKIVLGCADGKASQASLVSWEPRRKPSASGEVAPTSRQPQGLGRVVGRYIRTELVLLDELGYLNPLEGPAELVFQVI